MFSLTYWDTENMAIMKEMSRDLLSQKYISGHQNPRDIYATKLIGQGIINDDHVSKFELEYFSKLETELTDSKKKQKTKITPFMQEVWEGFTRVDENKMLEDYKTSSFKKDILNIAKSITTLPNKLAVDIS